MTDLHSRLVAALQARLEVARAAQSIAGHGASHAWLDDEGRLRIQGATAAVSAESTAHIAANSPKDTIRRVEALLRVVERHRPRAPFTDPLRAEVDPWAPTVCHECGHDGPCPTIWDIAAGEGIEVEP